MSVVFYHKRVPLRTGTLDGIRRRRSVTVRVGTLLFWGAITRVFCGSLSLDGSLVAVRSYRPPWTHGSVGSGVVRLRDVRPPFGPDEESWREDQGPRGGGILMNPSFTKCVSGLCPSHNHETHLSNFNRATHSDAAIPCGPFQVVPPFTLYRPVESYRGPCR